MRISSLATGDRRAAASLMAASPLLRRYGVTMRTATARVAEAIAARDIVLVARDGSSLVGLAWAIATRALDRSAYLRLLLIAEGRRSSGVGGKLLAAVERRARLRGARHMLLLVTTTNRRARRFYRTQGYRYIGVLREFARIGLDEALYVKRLS
jgi:GNAT superfamily N-acetyltransferase